MGIFDDGYQQAIIDAARQPVDRPPAGFMEGFSASYDTTRQEDLSISERAAELSRQSKAEKRENSRDYRQAVYRNGQPYGSRFNHSGEGADIGRAADQRAFQSAPRDQERRRLVERDHRGFKAAAPDVRERH